MEGNPKNFKRDHNSPDPPPAVLDPADEAIRVIGMAAGEELDGVVEQLMADATAVVF